MTKMEKAKKKIKNFLSSKGGLAAVISVASLCVVGFLAIIIGYVYSDLGGDWSRLGELLGADWMVSIYILVAVILFFCIVALILINRRNEDY